MKMPPFLLGAAVLFWGFQTGILAPALALAVAVEMPGWIVHRWDLEEADFRRSFEIAILLTGGAAVYAFLTRDSVNGIMQLLRIGDWFNRGKDLPDASSVYLMLWSPLLTLPILLAQIYSAKGKLPLRALSSYFRLGKRKRPIEFHGAIDVRFIYFGLCLLSAGATNNRDSWYYTGVCVLGTGALWPFRGRRFSFLSWAGLIIAVVVLGFWLHTGLNQLQTVVESGVIQWISGLNRSDVNPRESRTALGRLGKLKLSGKIVLRVEPERGDVPELLREASYNVFRSPYWRAYGAVFREVNPEPDFKTWRLASADNSRNSILISKSLRHGEGILPLPNGNRALEELPVLEMTTNNFGVAKVADGPGLVRYRSRFSDGASIDSPPDLEFDLQVPEEIEPALGRVLSEMEVENSTASESIAALKDFFEANFSYTSYLSADGNQRTPGVDPITRFLIKSRSGHCEYFASATVLLLRQMKIPARYAVGYAVGEFDEKRNRYLVRERYAHAWCLYWDADRKAWRDLDTTPPSWFAIEEQNASWSESFRDAWSELGYSFAKFRWLNEDGTFQRYVLAGLSLTMLFAFWRIMRHRNKARRIHEKGDRQRPFRAGEDSEFYFIEKFLIRQGHPRRPDESPRAWIRRIHGNGNIEIQPLESILRLHYRYRFDPQPLPAEARRRLHRLSHSWIEGNARGK